MQVTLNIAYKALLKGFISMAKSSEKEARNLPVITPFVDGMKTYGFGKYGLTRAVTRFTKPPERNPYAVCFHFPGTFLSHRFVFDAIKTKIHFVQDAKIDKMEFVERNVVYGSKALDNRWIVTFNSIEARDELIRLGLQMYNKQVVVKRYDEIQQTEYKQFLEFVRYHKDLFDRSLTKQPVQEVVHSNQGESGETRAVMELQRRLERAILEAQENSKPI